MKKGLITYLFFYTHLLMCCRNMAHKERSQRKRRQNPFMNVETRYLHCNQMIRITFCIENTNCIGLINQIIKLIFTTLIPPRHIDCSQDGVLNNKQKKKTAFFFLSNTFSLFSNLFVYCDSACPLKKKRRRRRKIRRIPQK